MILKTNSGQRKAMAETRKESKPGMPDWITMETMAPMILGDLMRTLEVLAEIKDHLRGCGRRDLHADTIKKITEMLE